MTALNPAHIAWCRNLFDMLHDKCMWGIPRSGLIFQKQGDTLVLTERMPYMEGMPITDEELAKQQDQDYEDTCENFGAAGIKVRKKDDKQPPAFKVGDLVQTHWVFLAGERIASPGGVLVGRIKRFECALALVESGPMAFYVPRNDLQRKTEGGNDAVQSDAKGG